MGNGKILGMMLPKFLLIGELEIIGVLGLSLFKRDWDRYISFGGGVFVSLVVMIVEGVTGAAASTTEETGYSRGGVFIETSMLATRELGW